MTNIWNRFLIWLGVRAPPAIWHGNPELKRWADESLRADIVRAFAELETEKQ